MDARLATWGLALVTGNRERRTEGSAVKLYDFGILIIAALVASAIAAAILTQVHH
jgi:hypothetical protein